MGHRRSSLLSEAEGARSAGRCAGCSSAIALPALLFDAAHLPTAFANPPWQHAGVLLDAVAGMRCGWLFQRRSLEYPMLAHCRTDPLPHVDWPLLA
jgi:hypothetical protein